MNLCLGRQDKTGTGHRIPHLIHAKVFRHHADEETFRKFRIGLKRVRKAGELIATEVAIVVLKKGLGLDVLPECFLVRSRHTELIGQIQQRDTLRQRHLVLLRIHDRTPVPTSVLRSTFWVRI